jgi:hypothetical protein
LLETAGANEIDGCAGDGDSRVRCTWTDATWNATLAAAANLCAVTAGSSKTISILALILKPDR